MPDGCRLGINSARQLAIAQIGDIQLQVQNDFDKTSIEFPLYLVAQCFDAGTIPQGTCVIPIFEENSKLMHPLCSIK